MPYAPLCALTYFVSSRLDINLPRDIPHGLCKLCHSVAWGQHFVSFVKYLVPVRGSILKA